jgi:hypothetical protein
MTSPVPVFQASPTRHAQSTSMNVNPILVRMEATAII